MAANNFLDLLPSDLQICVLQTWISGAKAVTLTLSALDMACCQKAIRTAVLALFRSLLPIGSVDEPIPVNDTMGFVLWLSARSLTAEALFLQRGFGAGFDERVLSGGDRTFRCLSFIKTVSMTYLACDDRPSLCALLQACPNLTVMKYTTEHAERLHPTLWDVLASSHKLVSLSLPYTCGGGMIHCLQTIGQRMKALHFQTVDLQLILPVLKGSYPNLECLSIKVATFADRAVVELLQSCKRLEALRLFSNQLTTSPSPTQEDFDTMLSAGRGQLKKFKVDKGDQLLPFVLESHPWLECIHLAGNEYNRPTGRLAFDFVGSTSDLLRIFSACPRIVVMHYSMHNFPLEFLEEERERETLVNKLTHLEELLLWGDNTADVLRFLLPRCEHLKHIQLCGDMKDEYFELIAKHCPELTSLTVKVWKPDSITNQGVMLVIGACDKLKELIIRNSATMLTFSILQAILDNRLHLNKLSCKGVKFSRDELKWFGAMARKQELLPVPVVECAH